MFRKFLGPQFDAGKGRIILRCFARKDSETGQWSAMCLEFCLAAQGESLHEARRKLHEQITEHVEDALGEDRKYAEQLIYRPAPLSFWADYYSIKLKHELRSVKDGIASTFTEGVKMVPRQAA